MKLGLASSCYTELHKPTTFHTTLKWQSRIIKHKYNRRLVINDSLIVYTELWLWKLYHFRFVVYLIAFLHLRLCPVVVLGHSEMIRQAESLVSVSVI